ncbi:MAG: hypothetical protein P8X47_11940 [Ignavibacteriaceae bacterium]
MVKIKIENDKILFEVQGWDKLWSLRNQLEIPLAHINNAYVDTEPAMGWFQGLKLAGTDLPNLFKAGTFYQKGELVFWDVNNPKNTIVVELKHEKFKKLIVEVENPDEEAEKINGSLTKSS